VNNGNCFHGASAETSARTAPLPPTAGQGRAGGRRAWCAHALRISQRVAATLLVCVPSCICCLASRARCPTTHHVPGTRLHSPQRHLFMPYLGIWRFAFDTTHTLRLGSLAAVLPAPVTHPVPDVCCTDARLNALRYMRGLFPDILFLRTCVAGARVAYGAAHRLAPRGAHHFSVTYHHTAFTYSLPLAFLPAWACPFDSTRTHTGGVSYAAYSPLPAAHAHHQPTVPRLPRSTHLACHPTITSPEPTTTRLLSPACHLFAPSSRALYSTYLPHLYLIASSIFVCYYRYAAMHNAVAGCGFYLWDLDTIGHARRCRAAGRPALSVCGSLIRAHTRTT